LEPVHDVLIAAIDAVDVAECGAAFGGEGSIYRTKRGVEKGIFIATIILAILFFASALAGFILR